jgi:hypothetical protein
MLSDQDSFVTIHHQQLEREPAPNETEAMCGYATCTTPYAPRPKAFFAAPLIDAPLFHINTQSDALIVLYCILRQAARLAFYLWDTARNFNYRNGTHNVTTTVGVNDQSIWRRSQLAEIKHRKRTSYTP